MKQLACAILMFCALLEGKATVHASDGQPVNGYGLSSGVALKAPNSSLALAGNKVGVVDVLEVLNRSTAFNDLQQRFSSQIQADQSFIGKFEKVLRKKDEKLTKDLHRLNNEEMPQEKKRELSNRLVERRRVYERESAQLQDLIQKRKEHLDERVGEARMKIHKAILDIISSYAQENGFQTVVQQAQVLYVTPENDITQIVAYELNKRLPRLELSIDPIDTLKQSTDAATPQE